MGNAWYVSPLNAEQARDLEREGVPIPQGLGPSTAPSPEQVFAALGSFPEYRVNVRRRDRKDKGQAVYVELRRADGSHAVDIHLLRVAADDQPAGVFLFDYYRGTDELVRLVAELAAACGPLVLWHDSGGERSVLVTPPGRAEPSAAADRGGSS
jgi:hypothetical protein